MNYEQAMEYIHAVQWAGHKPGLSRTRTLLAALGDPHKRLRFVHVAGTNGKGSTAAMLASCLQAAGYRVHLVFLRLPTVEMAVERVAARVAQGGHDIPPQVIARRFIKGWRNFEQLYRGLVDTWQVFDNAGDVAVLLEEGERA